MKKICRHHKWMASMIYYSISDQTKMSIWMLIHFLLGLIIYLFVFFLSNQGGRRINFILCVSYPWLPFIWNIKNQMHVFIVSMISLDYLFSQYLVWLIVLLVNDWRKNPYLGWLFWFFSLHWLPPQSKVNLWNLNKKKELKTFSLHPQELIWWTILESNANSFPSTVLLFLLFALLWNNTLIWLKKVRVKKREKHAWNPKKMVIGKKIVIIIIIIIINLEKRIRITNNTNIKNQVQRQAMKKNLLSFCR